jgi:hypothetical protein
MTQARTSIPVAALRKVATRASEANWISPSYRRLKIGVPTGTPS